MAFSNGLFSRLYNWTTDAAAGIKIRSDRFDAELDGMATGLSTTLLKDGTQNPTANLPMATYRHTGVGAGTARTDYARLDQLQDGGPIWGGTSGGSANAHTVTLSPAVTGQQAGRTIKFLAGYTNTGAATLSPNGVPAAAFRKKTAAGLAALTGGEIVAGNEVICTDTGTYYILAAIPEGTKGADIASATTTDLGAATGDYVDVTGTTTITGLGTIAAGVERTVRFTGILTLTYNATSLILPGAATITTAAGDAAKFRSLGSGNWLCVGYTRASGAPVASTAASESAAGVAELATQAETNAGTDDARIVTPLKLATYVGASAAVVRNYIINPEGYVFQRTAPTTDNAYAWDRWRLLLGAANAATVSQLTTGLPTLAKNAMRLTVGSGNNNKFGVFQILEGVDVYSLRGKTISLTAQLQATTALADIRMAIVEWTGTEDATSSDPISAWNSAATVPTYAAGWANLNTPANLSVTTSFAQYTVTGTVGATATNLAVFIWCDDTGSTQTTDKLDVTMVQLVAASAAAAYAPRPYAQELLLCQRYCWGWATADGNIGHGFADGNTTGTIALKFPTTMRATPTFSVSGVTHFQVDAVSGTSGATTGLTAASLSAEAVDLRPVRSGSTWTAGQGIRLLAANASAKLVFTAEL